MTFYKIYDDRKFYGVGTTGELRRFQAKHRLVLTADESTAEFISVENVFFRGEWMKPVPSGVTVKECTVEAITEEDYNALKTAVDLDSVINHTPIEEPIEEEPEPEITADALREMKIREMSMACNQAITEGFSIELSDGESHHFSLTMQDQMNLLSVQTQILSGATEVAYHADGEEADMFSAEDMATVIAAANAHKTYQLAYFNALKKWLGSLKSIAAISAVKYGTEIPKKYQTALLKRLRP